MERMENHFHCKSMHYVLSLFIVSSSALVLNSNHTFQRLYRITPGDSGYLMTALSGIRTDFECAAQCITEECKSFLYKKVDKNCETFSQLIGSVTNVDLSMTEIYFYKTAALHNCSDLPPTYPSDAYPVASADNKPNTLFCNMDTVEGPWIVIQRRLSALVDFQRTWIEYQSGFGDLHGNFWIGNEFLHWVTSISRVLRIELEFDDGSKGYAQYSTFKVAGEDQKYRLVVKDYSGDLADDIGEADGSFFTTTDADNDQSPGSNCANDYGGGWWYWWCSPSNLNGRYHSDQGYGLFWNGKFVKQSEMMIR